MGKVRMYFFSLQSIWGIFASKGKGPHVFLQLAVNKGNICLKWERSACISSACSQYGEYLPQKGKVRMYFFSLQSIRGIFASKGKGPHVFLQLAVNMGNICLKWERSACISSACSQYGEYLPQKEKVRMYFFSLQSIRGIFASKGKRSACISSACSQYGEYLPQKGKVRENNSLFSRTFPF